jgi:hypothetical protein
MTVMLAGDKGKDLLTLLYSEYIRKFSLMNEAELTEITLLLCT